MRKIEQSGISEQHMYLLQTFADEFHFKHAEKFVRILEREINNNSNIIVR